MPDPTDAARAPSLLRRLLPLIGLCLLFWVISRLDTTAMWQAATRVPMGTLAAAAATFIANLCVKGLRWHRLVTAQGHRLPIPVAIAAYLSGQFYGHVTVGRVGELYRAEALVERGVPTGRALASCIADRLLDLALVLCLGGALAGFVLGDGNIVAAVLALVAVATAGGLGLWWLRPRGSEAPPGDGPIARVRRFAFELWHGAAALWRPVPLAEAIAWTALGWLGHFAALWFLAAGMGIGADRVLLTTAACMGALSTLLPVTVSGLGARELIYAAVLARQGVPAEAAVALSLLHLLLMTASAVGLGLLGLLWRRRQRRRADPTPVVEAKPPIG